jgi:putative RNA 2'-phosphotransferase
MGKDVSRFLSLVLRHKPETIGIKLDKAGWVDVDMLLSQLAKHNKIVTREELESIVAENDKKRYVLSEDGLRIRAAQGHSLDVDLGLKSQVPLLVLYHGTVERFLGSIKKEGLQKMSRHHVHLSKDMETATKVGTRRGEAIILEVAAKHMHNDGHKFFISDNGVWLTDHVPVSYITFP